MPISRSEKWQRRPASQQECLKVGNAWNIFQRKLLSRRARSLRAEQKEGHHEGYFRIRKTSGTARTLLSQSARIFAAHAPRPCRSSLSFRRRASRPSHPQKPFNQSVLNVVRSICPGPLKLDDGMKHRQEHARLSFWNDGNAAFPQTQLNQLILFPAASQLGDTQLMPG
jgi:hypothetical protein